MAATAGDEPLVPADLSFWAADLEAVPEAALAVAEDLVDLEAAALGRAAAVPAAAGKWLTDSYMPNSTIESQFNQCLCCINKLKAGYLPLIDHSLKKSGG